MPIYAYLCSSCEFEKDCLQKLSDPHLTECPSCGADTFTRQVSAPAFQLKGSGWYVTDFRDGNQGGQKNQGKEGADASKSGDSDSASSDKPATEKGADKSESKSSKSADNKTASASKSESASGASKSGNNAGTKPSS